VLCEWCVCCLCELFACVFVWVGMCGVYVGCVFVCVCECEFLWDCVICMCGVCLRVCGNVCCVLCAFIILFFFIFGECLCMCVSVKV